MPTNNVKTPPLTVGELAELLRNLDQSQKLVASDVRFGDFDITGITGTRLSEDNFEKDLRPILRIRARF